MTFSPTIIQAAQQDREIELTTFGRKTGKPSRRIIWIATDGQRLFVRSGQGLGRDWPQNVLANGRAMLHIAGQDIPVRVEHVTDQSLTRELTEIVSRKYGTTVQRPEGGGPTPAEEATFELVSDEGE